MAKTLSIRPDLSQLSIAKDCWSEPYWAGLLDRRITLPRCAMCAIFRWPAGPFCPNCRSQAVEWMPAGQARIYSFTILPVPGETKDAPPRIRIPVLVTFDDAPGVRLVSALVDADPDAVRIDAPVEPVWAEAADGTVLLFGMGAPKPN